ncbi:MAG: hypothetical protein HC888_09015 [Candidatus Competibacteraceae bacterium]|nr:hypothetical protein [Candidatus Competibacteraceae bacterium]
MRHVLAAQSIPPVPLGMGEPAIPTLLVPATGLALGSPAGIPGASVRAINLATVAAGADHDAVPAAGAEESPADSTAVGGMVKWFWTPGRISAIKRSHPCSARVTGTASSRTCRLRSAPCPSCRTILPYA